jgi:hypothetical protein
VRGVKPARDRFRVLDRVALAVLEAQDVLQQDLQRDRQASDITQRLRRFGQREVIILLALDRQCAARLQGILTIAFSLAGSPSVVRRG